jgi:hypothetical protein
MDEDGTRLAYGFVFDYGTDKSATTAGQVVIDTTSGQVKYHDNTAQRVLSYEKTECVTLENLTAADDNYEFWFDSHAVTITKVGVHCKGTCSTPAQISLEDRAGNAMTHTTPTVSTGTSNTVFQVVTAENSLSAGEGLCFDVDNTPNPETDEYTICFSYTVNAD